MIWPYLFGQKGKMFLVGTEEFGVLIIVRLLFVLRTMESCQNTKGGSDDISNLQPLQWENNRAKSDGEEVPKVVAYQGRNVKSLYSNLLFE